MVKSNYFTLQIRCLNYCIFYTNDNEKEKFEHKISNTKVTVLNQLRILLPKKGKYVMVIQRLKILLPWLFSYLKRGPGNELLKIQPCTLSGQEMVLQISTQMWSNATAKQSDMLYHDMTVGKKLATQWQNCVGYWYFPRWKLIISNKLIKNCQSQGVVFNSKNM